MRRLIATALLSLGLIGCSPPPSSLPNPRLTPGAIDPAVTQDKIESTICRPGYARAVRPPEAYTEALKRRQMAEYAYRGRRLRDFEEDHLIPLVIGGAPMDPRNLWPEPRHPVDGWGAGRKDELERQLHVMICAGQISLGDAQRAIATDWIAAYRRFVE